MKRLRHLFPPAGPAYELFDASVFLLILGSVGYILTDPTAITDKALSAPFTALAQVFSDPQAAWGAGLSLVAIIGIACSYGTHRRVAWAYRLMIFTTLFASGSFMMGILLFGASPRAVISAVLYGWIASGLVRARRLYPFREVPW